MPFDEAVWKRLSRDATRVVPKAYAPWKTLCVQTPLPRLLAGDLAPGPHPKAVRLLITKLARPATPSFYTRTSATVETFTLDEPTFLLMPLCDGLRTVADIARAVAERTGLSDGKARSVCLGAVEILAKAGVLTFRDADATTTGPSVT